ncbi:MAG: aminomethyl-transferring glycine dehydrogenase subunit GcvPB [Hyphomicrobiales bacterium]
MNEHAQYVAPNDRPARPAAATFSGNRALDIGEKLIFEVGRASVTGIDIDLPQDMENRLGAFARTDPIGLPGLSEPEAMRHYVRLSRKNYSIDLGLYPLGSCTMKHNPRLNERMARLPGFSDIHPLQPEATVRGALELIETLKHWLKVLTGLPAIAMSPKAGAHGELCGMMAIRAALEARGDNRSAVLVPESAHGTNPSTVSYLGYRVVPVPARDDGTVDPAAIAERLSPHVAAIMLTNPNTCGLFERDALQIADMIHAAGGFFYCDGANFNAIMGHVRPGDLGVDAMHINLHKTFSTPHGGGGPGAGPVALSRALAPFAPVPFVVHDGDGFRLVEHGGDEKSQMPFGRMSAFHGQMGMFVRALAYMMSHGADGLRQAAADAVLNANYIRAGLKNELSLPYADRPCMHEVVFSDAFLKGTGLSTLDFAKAMIDEGFHPMTVYFPLVVHGAMLIEPTESESKAALDQFIATLKHLAQAARKGDKTRFTEAPRHTPVGRLDEAAAARHPVLRWGTNKGRHARRQA